MTMLKRKGVVNQHLNQKCVVFVDGVKKVFKSVKSKIKSQEAEYKEVIQFPPMEFDDWVATDNGKLLMCLI